MLPGEESGKVRAAVILYSNKKEKHKKRPAKTADLSTLILLQVKLQSYLTEGNLEYPLIRQVIYFYLLYASEGPF